MRVRGLLLAVVTSAVLGAAPRPSVATPPSFQSCLSTVSKEARTFFVKRLRAHTACRDAALRAPGACPDPAPDAFDGLVARMRGRIVRACDTVALGLLGFPGPCVDQDASDGFSAADLAACIATSHADGGDALLALLYDSRLVSPLRYADLNCQKTVGKSGTVFAGAVLGAVRKCRVGILRGKIYGVRPERCAVDHAPTREAILGAERKLRRLVDGRCTNAQSSRLFLCEPDQPEVSSAVDCLIGSITRLVDDDDPTAPPDLIDHQFAGRPRQVCGDDRADGPIEECDGTDDRACPGSCGPPSGLFPCLCQDLPRQRVIEHANADFDLWSSGTMHDQHVVEGGGYVVDLWDCDGPEGPDTRCTVGPSCSLPPHVACSPGPAESTTGDAMCAALGLGTCRKRAATPTGPRCLIDHQRRCTTNAQCPLEGDRCVTTMHGPPLPVSAGGVGVCLVRTLSEDVVGWTDLATGESEVRLRERLRVHLGATTAMPCPVCGGFCAGPSSPSESGTRRPCASDADCASPPYLCVTEPVCSHGPNVDAPCRPSPPFGGDTDLFGTTSVDCPPPTVANVTDAGLDLLAAPRTTGTVTLPARVPCTAPDVAGTACVGGAGDGRPCADAGDCPGGSCRPQCFCGERRPNPCAPACVGGAFDAEPCGDDADCPGGFCRAADCRVDPSDTDSCQEGRCTVGPVNGTCSTSRFRPCTSDADCAVSNCPLCVPNETCVFALHQCFVNGEIERCGSAGVPDRTTAAIGCLVGTGNAAVDGVSGAPGPTGLTQPETTVVVGF